MRSDRADSIGTDADCRATDPKLPEDWLCLDPSDVCISVHNSEAAYCCPKHDNCDQVPTVPYRVRLGPINVHTALVEPDNIRFFMLNASTTVVASCGVGACPRGFNCHEPPMDDVPEPLCKMIGKYAITSNKDSAPLANLTYKATETKTVEPLVPTTATNVSDTMNTGVSNENDLAEDHGGEHANAAVIAGATIGAAVGIIAIVLAFMIYLRYMRKAAAVQSEKDKESENGSSQEVGYWSYDGRRDAAGRLSRKWSDSTLQ